MLDQEYSKHIAQHSSSGKIPTPEIPHSLIQYWMTFKMHVINPHRNTDRNHNISNSNQTLPNSFNPNFPNLNFWQCRLLNLTPYFGKYCNRLPPQRPNTDLTQCRPHIEQRIRDYISSCTGTSTTSRMGNRPGIGLERSRPKTKMTMLLLTSESLIISTGRAYLNATCLVVKKRPGAGTTRIIPLLLNTPRKWHPVLNGKRLQYLRKQCSDG
jgi:hypothetical protein